MTALLEYLSVLLEYIDLFRTFSQHLYDVASYKSFLLAKSTVSFGLLKVATNLNSTNIAAISDYSTIMPVAILLF